MLRTSYHGVSPSLDNQRAMIFRIAEPYKAYSYRMLPKSEARPALCNVALRKECVASHQGAKMHPLPVVKALGLSVGYFWSWTAIVAPREKAHPTWHPSSTAVCADHPLAFGGSVGGNVPWGP